MNEFLQSVVAWTPGLIGMLCLIGVSSFFSGSETALFYLSRDDIRAFRKGNWRERLAADLLADPDRLLTAILFWNLIVNLAYFAISVVIAQKLVHEGQNTAAGLFSLGSLVLMILLGEVTPKSVAVLTGRALACTVSIPLAFAVRFLDPLLPTLNTTTRMIRRGLFPHVKREPYLHADDLEKAVEASHLSEEVMQQERTVLHNILDLSEITVEELMRPRGSYLTATIPVHLEEISREIPSSDYLIIQHPDNGEVAGAIALSSFSTLPQRHLEDAAEEVVYVPWCATLAYTLQLLRTKVSSLACVVNEYGDLMGIVTYEDLIDTIISPEPSRAKRLLRRDPILEVAPGVYHVDGLTSIRYLCKRLDLEYEPTAESLITVAGMMHEELEHLPAVGDECQWEGFRLRVIETRPNRHIRVVLSPMVEE